ncbi:MAG: MFS transporter [Nakamurella sp.]
MTRQPEDPQSPADQQRTTALPRRPPATPDGEAAGEPRVPEAGPGSVDPPAYQETTVLRRPPRPSAPSNVPGATRPRSGSSLPPYSGPNIPARLAGVGDQRDHREPYEGHPYNREPSDNQPYETAPPHPGLKRQPRKLTVTRVAALRSRELTHRGLEKFHGAVSADGAGRSGLSQLTYAVMGNYAVDAALTVGLANTLFFAAAKAESTSKVLLYLLLTVAPFAVIAPLLGPALDKLQRGRRLALAASSIGRTVLAVVMALNFDSWIIYPCALGMLVLSKGFGVLKAALTPRVLPETITLVKTNSRLSVFGLISASAAGGIAAGIAALTTSAGALWFTAVCGIVGAWLCLRIPSWVESTEGEVPIQHTGTIARPRGPAGTKQASARSKLAGHGAQHDRRVLPQVIVQTLWANSVIRIETGFLALFVAFVIKTRYQTAPAIPTPGVALGAATAGQGWTQLLMLGAVGLAAGLGGFLGNALGARLPLKAPETVALWCLGAVVVAVIIAFAIPGLFTAGIVALVGSTGSSLAKVCLDATIQLNLPEDSRASAFGRSESVLQLSWVFGGVLGLLIGGIWALNGDSVYLVGFGIVGVLLIAGMAQCLAVRLGRTLVPSWRSVWHLVWRKQPRSVGGPATAGAQAHVAPPTNPGDRQPPHGTGPGSGGNAAPPPVHHTRKAGRPR